MKKSLLVLAVLCISFAVFANAAAETAEAASPYAGRSISVAWSSSELNDSYQAIADAFMEKYGCTVEVELLPADADTNESVMHLRAATGSLPDVFQSSIGAKLKNFDPEKNIVELTGKPFMENVTDAFIKAASQNGKNYQIPSNTANVAGVFYNKKVLSSLGYKVPETWAEMIETCKKIRKETKMDPICNPYDGAAGKQITYLSQYFYIQQENPSFAEDYTARKTTLSESKALVRGLQKVYDMWEQKIQNEDPLSTSLQDAARAICDGTAAFVICRTNIMSSVEVVAPDKYNDIGFFPLPDLDADKRGVAVWMPQGWSVAKNCKDQELALLYLDFLTTPEAIDAYCSKMIPTGAFMLKGINLPSNVSVAVNEAQQWVSKSSVPVMEYVCPIKGANLPPFLAMVGTGEMKPAEAVKQIEADFQLNAEQNGIW